MKKRHDTTLLANELDGSSAFFQEPHPSANRSAPPEPIDEGSGVAAPQHDSAVISDSDRATERPVGHPASRPVPKRVTQRRAFEFYRDQMETFKAWAAVEIAQGSEGNMSNWAREAFDDYIAKHSGNDRSSDQPLGRPAHEGKA